MMYVLKYGGTSGWMVCSCTCWETAVVLVGVMGCSDRVWILGAINPMKVVFDLDGVLADFIYGFTALGNQMFGSPIYKTSEQKVWEKIDGLDAKQIDKVWRKIDTLPTFWQDLNPMIDKIEAHGIETLAWEHDVYFVTNRDPVNRAKQQTEEWLRRNVIKYGSPTVVMTKDKAAFCKEAKIDVVVEDRLRNALWITYASPKTKVLLLNQPYNVVPPEVMPAIDEKNRLRRVFTVQQALEVISYMQKGAKA